MSAAMLAMCTFPASQTVSIGMPKPWVSPQAADRRSEILLGRARLLVLGGLEKAAPRTKVPLMEDANDIIDHADLPAPLIAADRRVTSSRPLALTP
jgi:hypothetical protein